MGFFNLSDRIVEHSSKESDFSASTTIRDRHLNLFRTIRGIADLTLNYLDKTVAAGLNITQQGADTNATHHLLKQILWSVSKMANPRRTRIYEDTDEKLLACLMTNADPSRIGPDDQQISFDCPGVCGPRPVFSPVTGTGANRIGGGIIDYCVCCAEQSTIVNKSNPDSKVNGYSLVERLFFGRKKPDNHTYPKPGPAGGSPLGI